ncbi:hypothetical protein Tco_1090299 [Tanacetum coccineum]|uniref:Uncharacterized protein n=1 Tax=Tanacetum coccineum TaxID=301880 RepID=A0ABQ5I4Y7_9ASTR
MEDLQLAVKSYQKKINLTRPNITRPDLRKITPYTGYPDVQGIIYQDELSRNWLMRTDELHKFSDGTLNHVRITLNDIATRIQMDYLPKRRWSPQDKRRARVMISAINRKLRDRRLIFDTLAGNPVKEILLKLNLPDLRSILTDSKVVHDKEFNERTIHTFQGSRTKYSEEEVAGIMTETMEQYMTKTQADYGSGVARPKIEDEDNFELKGQFLKELRTNTFSGSDHEDAKNTLRKFLRSLIYSTFQEVILFYNGLGIPTRQILDSRGAIPSKTVANEKLYKHNSIILEERSRNATIERRWVIEELELMYDELNTGINDYCDYGALMNVLNLLEPFLCGDFTVLENMDAYRDERMGDVLFGEPFLRDVGI